MPRRRQRLRDFNYATAGAYFVTICTSDRRPRLIAGLDAQIRGHLALMVERFPGITLDQSVVMPDHVHFIVMLDGSTPPLPRILQGFKSLTTLLLPREQWPLWQRGYYEHVIRDEDDLRMIREYIYDNPLAKEVQDEACGD